MKVIFEIDECRIKGKVSELRPIVCCIYAVHYDSFTQPERSQFADDYWRMAYRERVASGDLRGAWHVVMMSRLGCEVLVGADRICRPLVEGEPLGLLCSLMQTSIFISELYDELLERGYVEETGTEQLPATWNVDGNDDFPAGIRIARAIWKLGGVGEKSMRLGLKALAIARRIDNIRADVPDRMVA